MKRNRTAYLLLLGLTLAAAYGCFLLIAPFLKPILFAGVIAVLFYPIHSWIQRRLRNRTLAALLTTSLVVVLLVVSIIVLGRALATGIREIYDVLNPAGEGREGLGVFLLGLSERIAEIAGRYFPFSSPNVHSTVADQAQKAVAVIVNWMAGMIKGITASLLGALIGIFILFFLFRDGRNFLRRIYALLPLHPDQTRNLFARIQETLHAIVYGTLVIAGIQGLLTGLGLWILGVMSPILWGIITALCALVPVIGTGFVLVPAICMLAFSGHWIKALILIAWGLAIVHPIDNVLRPYLIGEQTKLSTLFVFFSLLGGLRVFGAMGVFLGPVILAVALALFQLLREDRVAGCCWGAGRETSLLREASPTSRKTIDRLPSGLIKL